LSQRRRNDASRLDVLRLTSDWLTLDFLILAMKGQPIMNYAKRMTLSLAGAFCLLAPAAAYADTTPVDCSTADTAIMKDMPDSSAMKSTGNVDMDFATSMMALKQSAMSMAKIEMQCGKNAKAKTAAKKMLDQDSAGSAELREIVGGGH
jgi:uncharacterized protein (DUF305 family)